MLKKIVHIIQQYLQWFLVRNIVWLRKFLFEYKYDTYECDIINIDVNVILYNVNVMLYDKINAYNTNDMMRNIHHVIDWLHDVRVGFGRSVEYNDNNQYCVCYCLLWGIRTHSRLQSGKRSNSRSMNQSWCIQFTSVWDIFYRLIRAVQQWQSTNSPSKQTDRVLLLLHRPLQPGRRGNAVKNWPENFKRRCSHNEAFLTAATQCNRLDTSWTSRLL